MALSLLIYFLDVLSKGVQNCLHIEIYNKASLRFITANNTETLTEIKEVLTLHKKDLTEKYHVKDIGIFGSYVKGKQRKRSDIDILVEFTKPIGLSKFMEPRRFPR